MRTLRLVGAVVCLVGLVMSQEAYTADTKGGNVPGQPAQDSERKAIRDALRAEVRRVTGLQTVFVVRVLRVEGAWAWAETLPQSPDGKSRYEPVSGLLKRTGLNWKVIELRPTECADGDEEWCDDDRYFAGLKRRFPQVPKNLFGR